MAMRIFLAIMFLITLQAPHGGRVLAEGDSAPWNAIPMNDWVNKDKKVLLQKAIAGDNLIPLKEAADAGDAHAAFIVSFAFEQGLFENAGSISKSMEYLKQACNAGHAFGCIFLSDRYRWGDGVREDQALAFEYTAKSCDLGYPDACAELGGFYKVGSGTRRDLELALKYFKLGCDQGSGIGCEQAAQAFARGGGTEKNAEAAMALYEKACDIEPDLGCRPYAEYLLSAGDLAGTARMTEEACKNGDKEGCALQGLMIARGQGFERSIRQAELFYSQNCPTGANVTHCKKLKSELPKVPSFEFKR